MSQISTPVTLKTCQATNDFVVRFANTNGTGSASANNMFAKSIIRMGIPVSAKNIFPSNIQGMPTWYDGELQGDWETFLPKFEEIDFKGKKVAFFGLGDQYGYSFYFCDALGIFYTIALKNGAEIHGKWPTDGYEYDACKAEIDGVLVGLCIDIDNEDDLTEGRLEKWIPEVLEGFNLK